MGLHSSIGTVATRVRKQVERAGTPATPLEDRLGGVSATAVIGTGLATGELRREDGRYVHVASGRRYRTKELLLVFLEGWRNARSNGGDPGRSQLRWAEDEQLWVHDPSGERFGSDLAAQTFETGWEAGRGASTAGQSGIQRR